MPRIDANLKEEIALLPKEELVKLVIAAARKSKEFHDYLMVNHINKAFGEQQLFEEAKEDLQALFFKGYNGASYELRLANMLAACSKRINEFGKVINNKSLEMDLIIIVLKEIFTVSEKSLSTCFTRYNYQIYLLINKAIGLVNNKLHEDYKVEYVPEINRFLTILHRSSNHLDYIYALPASI